MNITTSIVLFPIEELEKLIANLFNYNYLEEFEDDIIKDINGLEHVVYQANIRIAIRNGPWNFGNLKDHRHYFKEPLKLTKTTHGCGRDYLSYFSIVKLPLNNPHSDHNLMFTPITRGDFPDKCWEDITFQVELTHPINYKLTKDAYFNCYPSIVDEKFMIHKDKRKEVESIKASSCPIVHDRGDSVKKKSCEHYVRINFKDGTDLKYLIRGPEISVSDLEGKGYLPFITQCTPDDPDKYQKQLECCELARKIGKEKQIL
ncbi:Hypothetical protein HVR_LOCUS579 [uncultured virus]|nr:Hypothetical protein HVR_LOCUS579 [uncultured virus]